MVDRACDTCAKADLAAVVTPSSSASHRLRASQSSWAHQIGAPRLFPKVDGCEPRTQHVNLYVPCPKPEAEVDDIVLYSPSWWMCTVQQRQHVNLRTVGRPVFVTKASSPDGLFGI